MDLKYHHRPAVAAVSVVLAGLLLAWPTAGLAQLGGLPLPTPTTSTGTVTGQAAAVQASVLGILGTVSTTTLSGTGSLASANDALDASQFAGNLPSLLSAEALQADAIGLANEVDSEASLAGLNLTIAGIPITADFVRASAVAISGGTGSATSEIDNLAVNGIPIAITGAPNQTVTIPGGQMVINEQAISSTGATMVNALHVTVSGIADVVIASATAAIP